MSETEVQPEPETAESEAPESSPTESKPSSRTDAFWNACSEEDKVYILQKAAERERQLEEDKKATKEEPKPEPEPESDDPSDKVLKKLAALEAKLTERERKEAEREEQDRQAKAAADFYQTLDGVLDSDEVFAKDSEARELLKEAFSGHWLKHKPRDIERSFGDFIKRFVQQSTKLSKKEHADYVRAKLSTAKATKGETRTGSAPAKEEYRPTGADLDSGALADRIKEHYGVG